MTTDDLNGNDAFEARVRAGLVRRAEGPVAVGDLGDLSMRIARSARRRQRLLGTAAVVALCAGVTGGYLVAGTRGAATAPSASPASAEVRPSAGVPAGSSAAAGGGGAAAGAAAGMGDAVAPCAALGVAPAVGSATHVFTRTTADGIVIRVYRVASTVPCGPIQGTVVPSGGVSSGTLAGGASGGTGSNGTGSSTGGSGSGSVPVPVCPLGPVATVGLSDDTAVGQGTLGGVVSGTGIDTTDPGVPTAQASGAFGVDEGDPVWWVAVRVGPDVASVGVTFADGSTDQMAPVDGIAVLAHHIAPTTASGTPGPEVVRATVRLVGSSGAVLGTVTLPAPTPTPSPTPTPAPSPGETSTTTTTTTVAPGGTVPEPTVVPNGSGSAQGTPDTTQGQSGPQTAIACPMIGGIAP